MTFNIAALHGQDSGMVSDVSTAFLTTDLVNEQPDAATFSSEGGR